MSDGQNPGGAVVIDLLSDYKSVTKIVLSNCYLVTKEYTGRSSIARMPFSETRDWNPSRSASKAVHPARDVFGWVSRYFAGLAYNGYAPSEEIDEHRCGCFGILWGIRRALCSRHRCRTVERTIRPPGFSSSANSLRPPSTSPPVPFHLLPRLLFESVPPSHSSEPRNESPTLARCVQGRFTKCKPLNASRPTLSPGFTQF